VEFPQIEKMVDKYGPKDFVVVTVNTPPSVDATGKLMMARKGYNFTHLAAPDDGWAARNYQIKGYPTTILLDAGGKVILQHSGYDPRGIWAMDHAISHLIEAAKLAK
jgi:thiol-disulfide isomerase/thioredoxin